MTELSLRGLMFEDPDGGVVAIERLLGADHRPARWLVIQALRYYG